MKRIPEPELMDLPDEVRAYVQADFREVNQRFVARLIELCDAVQPAAAAVDLGCGPGEIALLLARARPQWRVTAVDASAPMLDVARAAGKVLRSQVAWQLADATRTGLPPNSFDVIFSNSLLHHVSDPLAMWREISGLARPGAVVFVRDLMRPDTEAAAAEIVRMHAGTESTLLQEEFHRSLLSAYTAEEIRGQLRNCGLSALAVTPCSDRHVDVWGRLPGSPPALA